MDIMVTGEKFLYQRHLVTKFCSFDIGFLRLHRSVIENHICVLYIVRFCRDYFIFPIWQSKWSWTPSGEAWHLGYRSWCSCKWPWIDVVGGSWGHRHPVKTHWLWWYWRSILVISSPKLIGHQLYHHIGLWRIALRITIATRTKT